MKTVQELTELNNRMIEILVRCLVSLNSDLPPDAYRRSRELRGDTISVLKDVKALPKDYPQPEFVEASG